uniref:Plasmid maintenance system killer protein n=1 Tax=Candidatus Kentrum sp. FW TaxID=2126338 RepID=A0A450U4F7_9GAMM|nr:MAG: Plasmid maintenance system killer protein [Candidatus Kentron sp. FW]
MVLVDYDKGFFKSVRKRLPRSLYPQLESTLADMMRDPQHPGLNLETIVSRNGYYSIRVNRQWRILLRREGEKHFTAIEVGSHAVYR